jgi:prefoldin subunit 5
VNSLEKRIEFLEKQNEQLQKDVELLVKSVLRLNSLIDSLVNDSLSSSIKTLEKIDKLNDSFD